MRPRVAVLRKLVLGVLAGVLVAVCTAWPSSAGGPPDERASLIFNRDWIAYSTTARGITGAAWLTPTSITFDDRVTFKLRYLSEVAPAKPDRSWGKIREFSLFEIVDPRPQEILNGNHLCGNPGYYSGPIRLARYLAVGLERRYDGDKLLIIVFRTETPPDIMQEEGLCSELGYFADPLDLNEPKSERKRRASLLPARVASAHARWAVDSAPIFTSFSRSVQLCAAWIFPLNVQRR